MLFHSLVALMSRVENRKLRLLKEMLRKIFLTVFKLNRVLYLI